MFTSSFCLPLYPGAWSLPSLKLEAWRYLGYRPLDWLRSSHAGGLIRFSSTIIFPSAMFHGQICPLAFGRLRLDPRSVTPKFTALAYLLTYYWSGLKFYNLHQTLNTSINALNSFLDIYLISSARTGFVFFISFTSFFLTLICPHHILSGMSCQACCLKLAAWSVALFCRYLVSVTCESLKLEIQFAV